MNPAPEDSQGAQHGESVQQAVELVGKMLEQIQVELEKMLSQGGKVPVSSIFESWFRLCVLFSLANEPHAAARSKVS